MIPETCTALIIDDDSDMTEIVGTILENEGITIVSSSDISQARSHIEQSSFDLIVTDLNLPDGDGQELIELCRKIDQYVAIVVLTGYPDEKRIRDMMAHDISTFLVKPFTGQQLKYVVIRALEERKVRRAAEINMQSDDEEGNTFGLVGISSYVAKLRKAIRVMAAGDFPVLIHGPSGTGKEIIANALHSNSKRSEERIVTINCAAIPHHLEESEFFGYAKGAFTDARTAKHGILECADRSTIFLDEIGELSLAVQAKLLRVLDTGEYIRIGEVHPKKVDIRIVSATNRNLEEMVTDGSFRVDLYFRLKGAMISTAPLASHKDDIPSITLHFIKMYDSSKHLTQGAYELLQQYSWPGNIRELKNTIHFLVASTKNQRRITAEMVADVLKLESEITSSTQPFSKVKEEFERDYFVTLLRTFNGNISRVARESEIHRPNLIRKLKELGICPESYRTAASNTMTVI